MPIRPNLGPQVGLDMPADQRLHYSRRRRDMLCNREVEKLQPCVRPDTEYQDDAAP